MRVIVRRAGAHALEFTDPNTDAGHAGIIAKVRDCVRGHGFVSNLLSHFNAGTSLLIAPFKR